MNTINNPSFAFKVFFISAVSSLAFFVYALLAHAAGPWFVDPAGSNANDCLSAATACLTIGGAIGKASPGDTINVAAGTYAENVVLNKSLNLKGVQSGVDARGRVASEAIIAPAAGIGITLTTGSAGATIDGFTISGGTRGIESTSGPIDNLTIKNNRITGFTSGGIFLNDPGTDMTVDRNLIDGSSKTGSGGLVHMDTDAMDGFWFTNNNVVNGNVAGTATGLFSDSNRNVGTSVTRSPKMAGNLFQANTTGVNLGSRSWEFADIFGNTFKNNSFDGLQGGPATTTVMNNVFDGNGRSGLALTSFGNTSAGRGAFADTISFNTFVGNGVAQNGEGIYLSGSQPAGTIRTNVINRNSIAGNNFGLRYGGAEAINAECNWWGNLSGPGPIGPGSGDSVGASATVDYTPWLTSSDLNGPCNGPLPNVTVTIIKYIGVHATPANASSASFPMQACWSAGNIGSGCGNYPLSTAGFNNPNPYEATTASMSAGADYSTSEDLSTATVGASCTGGKLFQLVGYTTGDTEALAATAGTPATTTPSFTGLTSDKVVIVWNTKCPPPPPQNACSLASPPPGYTLVVGTSKSESFTLAPNTMLRGMGGSDTVNGPNGNYIICLGGASDRVTLGDGDVTIDAGDGGNVITVGNGNGYITAGNASDNIRVGNGTHTINAANGGNVIVTGDGDQTVTAGSGSDTITTGSGNDIIQAGNGSNNIKSGAGNDTITAGSGSDTIDAGPGSDTCNAGAGFNSVTNCAP
ncbi:MAG: hypothetical protein RLZZ416_205 [Candidatus Parcubacteria bacterium]|jgi:hypothetical protein